MSYQLYLGDCLDFMRDMDAGSVDAVITDPPYGIDAGNMKQGMWRTSRMPASDWDKLPGNVAPILLLNVPAIIWGGNYFGLPRSRCFLVWDKGNGFVGRDFAECEMAWTNVDANARIFKYDPLSNGDYKTKEHPTQKPLALMRWCIELFTKRGDTIFDPFMGSGTTGVACMQLGRNFIGCEIDPNYYAIAEKRIKDAAAQPPLFTLDAPKIEYEQAAML